MEVKQKKKNKCTFPKYLKMQQMLKRCEIIYLTQH